MSVAIIKPSTTNFDIQFDNVEGAAVIVLKKMAEEGSYMANYLADFHPKMSEAVLALARNDGSMSVGRCVATRTVTNYYKAIEVGFVMNIVLCASNGITHFLQMRLRDAYSPITHAKVHTNLYKLLAGKDVVVTEHDRESLMHPIVSLR